MDGHEYDCYYEGMGELDVLGFQIESLQHLFTTTSKDEILLLKLESFHKRYHLALYKLQGDQRRLMQRIEELQNQHDKGILVIAYCTYSYIYL